MSTIADCGRYLLSFELERKRTRRRERGKRYEGCRYSRLTESIFEVSSGPHEKRFLLFLLFRSPFPPKNFENYFRTALDPGKERIRGGSISASPASLTSNVVAFGPRGDSHFDSPAATRNREKGKGEAGMHKLKAVLFFIAPTMLADQKKKKEIKTQSASFSGHDAPQEPLRRTRGCTGLPTAGCK
jgi:hypothetical protein